MGLWKLMRLGRSSVLLAASVVLFSAGVLGAPPADAIAGGELAQAGEAPWTVSIKLAVESDNRHVCGGAIIGEDTVITAAKCVPNNEADRSRLRVGYGSLQHDETTDVAVASAYVHQSYNDPRNNWNDIAVLKLADRIPLDTGSQAIGKIAPPPADFQRTERSQLAAFGWGPFKRNGTQSKDLHTVGIPFVTYSRCKDLHENSGTADTAIPESVICAGGGKSGKGSCVGDEGGPLVSGRGDAAILVGIYSFGGDCGSADAPDVYTDVGMYRFWITEVQHQG